MSKETTKRLVDLVNIAPHYGRSIEISSDLGRADALQGYICHQTTRSVLLTMAEQVANSNQRAFTWTGPYGGGKSSLAVALGSALFPKGKLRTQARDVLQLDDCPQFDTAFPVRRGWLVIPVVGKRGSVRQEIAQALFTAIGGKQSGRKPTASNIITELRRVAESREWDGVLLIIDEMGKFLEASALESGDDIYFFQELADTAARVDGRLVVAGILHQSFRQYASRLGSETKDEWAKVQGRYCDIPIIAATDEVVEIVANAITIEHRPSLRPTIAKTVATAVRTKRPTIASDFSRKLEACWPLHPSMAAMLGPISRRQFGQNERSTFTFLASTEPYAFRSFLTSHSASDRDYYTPAHYWDYLRVNLEPAILASPDGHRWAIAADAVDRAVEKGGTPMHIALVKNIAVIDLFKAGSALAATPEVLHTLFPDDVPEVVERALKDLASWRVAVFKRHLEAWSLFEGSDFDIEQAMSQERAKIVSVDLKQITKLANIHPVVAKRHYHETGALRWMNVALCALSDADNVVRSFVPQNSEFGLFLLALPPKGMSQKVALTKCSMPAKGSYPIVLGIPANHSALIDISIEYSALQSVQLRPELAGDAVARRELSERIAATKASLEYSIRDAIANAKWIISGEATGRQIALSPLSSNLADDLYYESPKVHSELVNREALSTASVKARRTLLYHMVAQADKEALGFSGYPAERGLYEAVLRSTGLHCFTEKGNWGFVDTNFGRSNFGYLWSATKSMFRDVATLVTAKSIYDLWSAPPFGVRAGLHPILLVAFWMLNHERLSLYRDGIYQTSIDDVAIDELLQDPARFSLRWVELDAEKVRVLQGIGEILTDIGIAPPSQEPLSAARALVHFVLKLPGWTQRTQALPANAAALRNALAKANDPHKVLFIDLPRLLNVKSAKAYIEALKDPVLELRNAYQDLLERIRNILFKELDASSDDLATLHTRAKTIQPSGDLRQDAFVGHLQRYDGTNQSVERIITLAAGKPSRDWTDRDIEVAEIEIASFCQRFRHIETVAAVKNLDPNTIAFGVVIGFGATVADREFKLSSRDKTAAEKLAKELERDLKNRGLTRHVLLAALASAGVRLTEEI